MPKVLGPCFSAFAEGQLGGSLSFSMRRGYPQVNALKTPNIKASEALEEVQGYMRHTVETWQHLTENILDSWDTWASDYFKHASGFNAFTSYYLSSMTHGTLPDLFPPT